HRLELVDDLRLPRALGAEDPGHLVVQTAIATVQRVALDRREQHLDSGAAAGRQPCLPIGYDHSGPAIPEKGVLGFRLDLLLVVFALLQVDEQQRRAPWRDRLLPERHVALERQGIDLASLHGWSPRS